MLAAQARTLDLRFNRLARQGYAELGERIDAGQHYAWAATGEQRRESCSLIVAEGR